MTDLSTFNNSNYRPGNPIKRGLWYVVSIIFFESKGFALFGFKRFLLRAFGAKVAKGVVIKPKVTIKYPWYLSIGENTWIGEQVWIDNLDRVDIGANVCVSQGALLLTGNHDYSKSSFDLMTKPILLQDACWIGAKSVVVPGITVGEKAVLTVGSVLLKDAMAGMVYGGNPAVEIKQRPVIQ